MVAKIIVSLWAFVKMKLILVIGIVALSLLLLSVRVLLKKNGRFSSQHISESKAMQQRGIHCATAQDREARKNNVNRINTKEM